jgi:hypothetical protein
MHPVAEILLREAGGEERERRTEPAGGHPHAVDMLNIVIIPYTGDLF